MKVGACGVSYRDVVERNGTYRRDVTFPSILGIEIAGTVEAIGGGVERFAVGDRVCTKAFSSCGQCRYCRTGRETTCRQRRVVKGGYAQYVALAQDAAVAIPNDMPFEVACVLGPGAGVALNAVRDTAHVQVGEAVLVTGATGGVGFPAVQIARHAGAIVYAVTRSETKADALREAGAHHVVIQRVGENYGRELRDMLGGEGVDVVIDTVGSQAFQPAFDALAPHGRYCFVGQLTDQEISINPARIFFKRAQLLGVGSVSRAQLEDAVKMAAAGIVTPRIARVMPLADVAEAHFLVEAATETGRIVLAPWKEGEDRQ
ncbi:alcohol dehydrogenase [Novosphingobium endophyticum]|uniref:Alcohol dehydrogenase n=1 Tax=Novosphingobium endophyticum TaxID=1955250 RepID=A0A916X5Y8_9SPHN|nr:alcohol dehydrogenase [Novosphingobium endophyticum]